MSFKKKSGFIAVLKKTGSIALKKKKNLGRG